MSLWEVEILDTISTFYLIIWVCHNVDLKISNEDFLYHNYTFMCLKLGFYMEIGFQNLIVLAWNSENDYTVF